jgi:lipoprotein-releasing system ATP-binding protein
MNDIILKAENLGKSYPLPKGDLRVFEGIDFELTRGEFVAIMGVSGVGKTTFLNLLGALDKPSAGRIFIDEEDIRAKTEQGLADIRNRKIGFVFQFYHLLPEFTAAENAGFPLLIRGWAKKDALDKAREILNEVGLGDKAAFRPSQLSGGEQQRVAIARALVNDPKLLLADEPTGNLDWKAGEMILKLILDLHRKKGLSSIVVTHNEKIAKFCHKLYLMDAGSLKLLSTA